MNDYYETESLSYTTFRDYLNKTYVVLALGLLVSTLFAVAGNFLIGVLPTSLIAIASIVFLVLELGTAIFFGTRLMKMEKTTAWICYFLYSALTGLSLSYIFTAYTTSSVVLAFGAAAVVFVSMAVIGYTTKIDLRRFGTLFLAGLIASIVMTLLNAFLIHSDVLSMGICYLGIIIFLGLIAYDMQRLRDLYNEGLADPTLGEKLLVYGSFQLYLDFINLFIRILQIFGKRRD